MGRDLTYLVTGGNGQLGRALAASLPGAVVLGRDRCDITDERSVREAIAEVRPDVVINAAAFTQVDRAEAEPDAAHAVNAGGPANIASALQGSGVLLVQVSTDYVFDGSSSEPYPVDAPTGPASVYGSTKLAGEVAVDRHEPHLIVRTSWVYGQGHNFIASILGAARTRDELQVVDDQVGRPTYATDLARGIVELVSKSATGTFHLTGEGEPVSWAGLAAYALDVAGMSTKVVPVSTESYFSSRPGPIAPRPAFSVLDLSKAHELGVHLPDWRDSVKGFVATILA